MPSVDIRIARREITEAVASTYLVTNPLDSTIRLSFVRFGFS